MRIYLPSTLPRLAALFSGGAGEPVPLTAYAVTPALRESYAVGDLEELEYAAMTGAARASLRLLHADTGAPRRRVVLAADVPDAAVSPAPDIDRAAVWVAVAVTRALVASAHVDAPEAADDIAGAAAAVGAADLGDEDAQFTVDGAEGHELQWYATQEIPHLFTEN